MTGEHDGLLLQPWKKYGHDRVYVSRPGGSSLGYLDNKTGEVVVLDEHDRAAVERALGRAPAVPDLEYAVTVDRLAADLGANAPGASAATRAREERAAAPVRTLLARALGVHTDERAWRVGAQGERIVGNQLEKLTKHGWHVVHDVPVGERGANIDHVVVGPGGVFTVNSKYHWEQRVYCAGGPVYVNGRATKYVPVAEHEASRASKLLTAAHGEPVAVTAVLSIVCDNRVVKQQPRSQRVLVLGPRSTREYLLRLPTRYDPATVDRLVQLARRSTTWT